VLAVTNRGRVGIRVLDGEPTIKGIKKARIRVEPSESPQVITKMAGMLPDTAWKQPGTGGEHRFSVVSKGPESARKHVFLALQALGVSSLKTEVNPSAPQWARNLVASVGEA
jgi:hypothetical protein